LENPGKAEEAKAFPGSPPIVVRVTAVPVASSRFSKTRSVASPMGEAMKFLSYGDLWFQLPTRYHEGGQR
jgi:hypothetical protein